jgi:hypothetical protein
MGGIVQAAHLVRLVSVVRLVAILLALTGVSPPAESSDGSDLALTIEEDRGFSADHSTLCLVRVVNRGRSTFSGADVAFEARAIRDGSVAARQNGRFGLTLGPHETLETQVAFIGRYDRFEVSLAMGGRRGPAGKGVRGKKGGSGSKGPHAKKGRKGGSRSLPVQ